MSGLISPCLFLFFILLFSTKISSQLIGYHCPNTTTYSPNSTYRANLNQLLLTLSSNATQDKGFFNDTVGRGSPYTVFGLFLCRGDVRTDVCQLCVDEAATEILKICPEEKVAAIWFDHCMLRYSNQSIFSILDYQSYMIYMTNNQNVTEQPHRFKEVIDKTMNEVATEASYGDPSRKFASKRANFTALQSLFALGQCTPDISSGDCNTCLQIAILNLPNCCGNKQGGRVLTLSCNVRYEIYLFYNVTEPAAPAPAPNIRSLPLPPPLGPTTKEGNGGVSRKLFIAIVVPIIVSSVILVVVICFFMRKKHYDAVMEENEENEIATIESLQYDLNTIEIATNNFSADNKIGGGGFGDVYKGTLSNGKEIAVKRLSRSSRQGAKEFQNEVVVVAKLQHRNLTRLLGFCLQGEEKILIYEFVPNKSLDYFLFEAEKKQVLDWSKRYKIIGGIARGMVYLHEDSRLKIIHRDLKASNILLDGDMNPKISDFGMAKIFGVDESQGNTSRIVGTYGYMSPEYAMHGQYSVKSDVYSFGVLVLEIISGKKNSNFYESDGAEDLISYAWDLWNNGRPLEFLDPTLQDSYARNEVLRCLQIGLLCVQEDVDERPTMSSVVVTLNSYSVTLAVPRQPGIFLRSRTESIPRGPDSNQFTSTTVALSINDTSISALYPR